MNVNWRLFIAYIIFINLMAFCLFGLDKKKAKRHEWRTKEQTLLFSAIIGGSVGAWLGMHFFRHKTRHPKFVIGVPIIFLFQVCLISFLIYQL